MCGREWEKNEEFKQYLLFRLLSELMAATKDYKCGNQYW